MLFVGPIPRSEGKHSEYLHLIRWNEGLFGLSLAQLLSIIKKNHYYSLRAYIIHCGILIQKEPTSVSIFEKKINETIKHSGQNCEFSFFNQNV